jgi:hypothetical protein
VSESSETLSSFAQHLDKDRGPLVIAVTVRDAIPHDRTVWLRLTFGTGFPKPSPWRSNWPERQLHFAIYSKEAAADAYEHIIEYLKKYGYNRAKYFEQGRIIVDIEFGGFRRNADDLKHDLRISEPDLPTMPARIDLNREAENLGLSRTDALRALQREAAQHAVRRASAAEAVFGSIPSYFQTRGYLKKDVVPPEFNDPDVVAAAKEIDHANRRTKIDMLPLEYANKVRLARRIVKYDRDRRQKAGSLTP